MSFMAIVQVTVLLILSLTTLGLAASLAIRPRENKLALLRPLSAATLFSLLSATAAGIGNTFRQLAYQAEPAATLARQQAAAGFAEAMVPAVFGMAVLAIAWALAAVGLRRQP